MRISSIITGAATIGAAAFVWALVSAKPPARSWSGGRSGMARLAPEQRPPDLEGLEAYARRNPDDAEAWFELAELRRNAGDLGGERDAWQWVKGLASVRTERQREDPRGWFMLAWACDKLESEEGIAAWTRALELHEARADSPRAGNWRFWHRLGWCRARTGNQERAGEAWARGAAILKEQNAASEDRERSRHLVRALALAGQTEEALELLERTAAFWEPGALAHDESLRSIRGSARFRAASLRAMPQGRVVDGG